MLDSANGAIKDIVMDFATRGFLNTNAVIVILVGICTVLFQLSALFPSCRCAEVVGRVAVCIFIISYQPLFVKKSSAPNAGSEESTLSADAPVF